MGNEELRLTDWRQGLRGEKANGRISPQQVQEQWNAFAASLPEGTMVEFLPLLDDESMSLPLVNFLRNGHGGGLIFIGYDEEALVALSSPDHNGDKTHRGERYMASLDSVVVRIPTREE